MRVKVKRTNKLAAATTTTTRGMLVAVAAFAATTTLPAQKSQAQLYWDPDGTGAANGGAGTWTATSAWATDPSGTSHQTWANGNDAKFVTPTTGGTVVLGGNIVANSIEFTNASGGYTFSGGVNTLNPGGTGITLSGAATNTLQINATMTGDFSPTGTNTGFNITRNTPSTVSGIIRFGSANTFMGDININSNSGFATAATFLKVSFDAAGGVPTGSAININSPQIQIHANNGDTISPTTVVIGRVNLNAGGNSYFDGASTNATAYNTLQINGAIAGTGNVFFQGASGGQGGGVVLLNSQSTYSGDTTFNTTASGATNRGWVVWGVDNALPTTTRMIIGAAGSFGTGAIDLAGHSQSVVSFGTGDLDTNVINTGTNNPNVGITNSGSAMSTLTVTGSDTDRRVMNAPIGVTAAGAPGIGPGGTNPSNMRLVLASSYNGTLILSNATAGNSGNTYTGGTSVQGGTLLVNGWNSSTSSAAVVSAGATFGGSGTYAGTVTSSGHINVGGTNNVADFHTGALSLNPGTTTGDAAVDYDMLTTSSEKIVVNGAFTLPTSGTEDINITYPGGQPPANGLFSLVTYSGSLSTPQFNTLVKHVFNGGSATFTLQNNPGSVDLLVTGGIDALVWRGVAGNGSGNWDTTTTNWIATATPSLYSDGKITGFDDTANGTAGSTVTVTISNGGTPVQPFQVNFNNNSRPYVLTGTTATDVIGGTASVVKNGTGSLTINKVQSYTGSTNINNGTVIIGAGGGLGTTNLFVNTNGTLQIAGNSGITAPTLNLAGGTLAVSASASLSISPNVTAASTLNIGANTVTFSGGAFTSSVTSQLIMTGSGTLILSTPAPGMQSGWQVNGGTVVIDTVDSNQVSGIGVATGTNSTAWFNLASGTQLTIKNVTWGDYRNNSSSEQITMSGGSSVLGLGNAAYGRASAATNNSGLSVVRGVDSNTITSVTLKTNIATDTLAIQNAIRQVGTFGGVGNSLINVSGPGTIKLQDGGVSSATVYAGSWLVTQGTLQVGPVIYNPAGSGYGGPFGEPLNALGFAGTSANGDPDSPNPITLTGGILALADEQPNAVSGQNPNLTSFPVNPTPNYLRNSITLQGGALAATGFQVSYDTGNGAGDQGKPTATLVTAHFGGDLTIASGTSKILTYNPASLTEARTVQLVGGSRTITTASPNHGAGDVITYNTNWVGTLEVDPGTSTGGKFEILRAAGNVAVTAGAQLKIDQNATVNLGGAADPLNSGSAQVNVLNNSNTGGGFNATQGTKNVGAITGTGTTTVSTGGVTLIAKSVAQSTIAVSAGTVKVRASGGANVSTSSITTLTNANITGTGKFDITDNKVVTKSAAGTWNSVNYTGVTGLVATGKGTGNTWNGATGIITSSSNAVGTNFTSIGVAKASDAIPATATATASWGGQTITGTDTLVMYTYGGDATLDGKINIDDYIKTDAGFAGHLTGWTNGDFNYDGVVNVDDYITVIDPNFPNQTLGVFPTGGGIDGGIGGGASGVSAVPEPATLSLLGLAALGMMKRRRRQPRAM